MNTQTHTHARFGAVIIGALCSLLLQLMFTLLGSAIGLSVIDSLDETITIGIALFSLLSLLVSFFAGGYVASRLIPAQTKFSSLVHGVSVFSLVCMSIVFFVGSQATSAVGGLIARAGLGAGAAVGAGPVSDEIAKELEKVRIVTDLKILKGKAVTQLVIPEISEGNPVAQAVRTADHTAGAIKEDVEETGKNPRLKDKLSSATKDAKRTSAKAGLLAFAGLLLGSVAGGMGGFKGRS